MSALGRQTIAFRQSLISTHNKLHVDSLAALLAFLALGQLGGRKILTLPAHIFMSSPNKTYARKIPIREIYLGGKKYSTIKFNQKVVSGSKFRNELNTHVQGLITE